MKLLGLCIIGLIFSFIQCAIRPFGSIPLKAYSSNQKEITYFQFSFVNDISVNERGVIECIFPPEYKASFYQIDLECSMFQQIQGSQSSSLDGTYIEYPCEMKEEGIIRIQVGQIKSGNNQIVIGRIRNPSLPSTSAFGIRTYYDDVVVESNDVFSTLSLAPSPLQIKNPQVYRVSNSRISEGSTWRFDFQTVQSYTQGNSLRFTFPDGFQSLKVLCDVDKLYGWDPITEIYHDRRIVVCKDLHKTINAGELNSVKLINMKNPNFSGLMQGFTIEVLQGNSTIVLEKAYFAGNIEIFPGLLNATYKSDDNFKLSNTTYAFFINLINPVDSTGKLYLNFTNDWNLFSPNCTIISGFKLKDIFTSEDPDIKCRLLEGQNSYLIENFERIDSSNRLVVSMYLQSPSYQNQYAVSISTYNTIKNAFIDLGMVDIQVNATYGSTKVFAAHPMEIPVRLRACQSGPLEITLFLKYPLPQTNVGSWGKFVIDIFPQLPAPPIQNGKFKCYFFANVPASDCKFDDTSKTDRTTITIYTPEDQGFYQSEIPITITTEGPLPGYNAGLKFPTLVQRYIFQIHFWDCDCDVPTNTPREVFFTEFVPYPFTIPTNKLTAKSLLKNQNEFTYLKFKYTHPDNNGVCTFPSGFDLYETQRNYIYRIDFINYIYQGWQDYVGYGKKQVIQNYPCYVYGDQIDPSDKITCDLHCNQQQSWLTVQGFKTSKVIVGSVINIEIPRIGIADSLNVQAQFEFSLYEETPGMLDPYVQIYKIRDILFTSVAKPTGGYIITQFIAITYIFNKINLIAVYNTIPSITLSDSVVNRDATHTYLFNNVSPGTEFAIYELVEVSQIFPNLNFKVFTCGPGTSQCITYPSPVNWIVFTPDSIQGAQTQTIINAVDIFNNPPYADTFQYKVRTISNDIVTQRSTLLFNIQPDTFNPASIALDSSEDPTKIFKLLEHKFEIQITTQNKVQKDGGLILNFYNCELSYSSNFYLEINGITKLNQDGILYERVSNTQLKLYNIEEIAANTAVTILLFLKMPNTSTSNVVVDITSYWTRNFNNVVDTKLSLFISAPLNLRDIALQEFEVLQPVEINQTPGVDYIGPFFTDFTPKTANPLYIRCTWETDFTTPGVPGQDPLLCKVADTIVPCYYYTSSPLSVILNTSGISIPTGVKSQIEVNTQYVTPQNGLKFPSKGGWYEYDVEVLNSSMNPVEKYSQFVFITPKLMQYLKTESAISSQGEENMISFYFKNTDPIPKYTDGGLIQIEFPTKSLDGTVNIFDSALGISGGVTGTSVGCWFSASVPGTNLSCSLIKSQTTGRPAYIEIHNFDLIPANSDIIIRIGGIRNPTNDVSLATLTVTILQRDIAAGTYLYIHQMKDSLALNIPTLPNPIPTKFKDINVIFPGAAPQFQHPLESNVNLSPGDYFITILPNTLLDISTNQGILPSCDLTVYEYCIAFSQIRWIVLKLKTPLNANTPSNTLEDILQLPTAVPSSGVSFPTRIWVSQSYNTYLNNIIDSSVLDGIVTPITVAAVKCAGLPDKCLKNKQRVEVLITFTNPKDIPADGAVLIKFPPEIPNIYSHCRSATASGSQLYTKAGDYSGEVGCEVQNTRDWVINNFKLVTANSNIAIYGYVDMPIAGGVTQNVQIFVYKNYDSIDQFNNGLKMMKTTTGGTFTIKNQDPLELSERTSIYVVDTAIKQGYIGPFTSKLNFNAPSGVFKLYFALKDYVNNSDSVGFGITAVPDKYKCSFYTEEPSVGTLSNYMNCYVKSIFTTSSQIVVEIKPLNPSSILSGITYTFELTSQKGDGTVEGIEWPTKNGVYQIVIENTSINLKQSIYIDIIQDKFTNAEVQGYVTMQGETNLVDVSLTPSVQIVSNNLLVLEIGAISSDQTSLLFDVNSGNRADYDQVIIDIVPTTATALNFECRFSKGNVDTSLNGGISIKILCSKFSRTIPAGEVLRFVFEMTNPTFTSSPQQIVVPLNIYTYDVAANRKINHILIENNSLFVTDYNSSTDIINSSATFTANSASLAITTADLLFKSENSQPIGERDTYILRFQFQFVASSSLNIDKLNQSGVIGQVILLQNLKTLILNPKTGKTLTNASQSSIVGCWNTPPFLLATYVTGYAYYRSSRKTEKIIYSSTYGDGSGTPTPATGITLKMSLVNSITLAGQLEDYIISVKAPRFKSTKKLMIKFPTNIFGINSYDCMLSAGSQIEISRCYMNQIGSEIVIWVDITSSSQHQDTIQELLIQTRNLAMRNPSNANIVVNMNTFFVKFFYWYSSTEPANIDTDVVKNDYVIQSGTDSSGTIFTFATNAIADHPVLEFKHTRYVDDFYLSDGTLTRALIQFEMKVPTAIAASVNNALTIVYPSQIVVDSLLTQTSDVVRNTIRCMINNNYRKCTINTTTRTISIAFTYAVTANQIIFVQVGIIDPFNYPQNYGFGWNSDYTYGQYIINISENGVNKLFISSDIQNMKAKGTGLLPTNGFSAMTVRNVQTSVINEDCLIELVFTWSVSDVKTLVIEIATTNEDQTPIYDTDIFPGFQSGQNIPCVLNPPSSGSNNFKEDDNTILECIIERGEVGNFGKPMRIYVRGFKYTVGLSNNFLFKIVNPSVVGRIVNFKIKALGGDSSTNFIGDQLIGWSDIYKIVSTVAGDPTTTVSQQIAFDTTPYGYPFGCDASTIRSGTALSFINEAMQIEIPYYNSGSYYVIPLTRDPSELSAMYDNASDKVTFYQLKPRLGVVIYSKFQIDAILKNADTIKHSQFTSTLTLRQVNNFSFSKSQYLSLISSSSSLIQSTKSNVFDTYKNSLNDQGIYSFNALNIMNSSKYSELFSDGNSMFTINFDGLIIDTSKKVSKCFILKGLKNNANPHLMPTCKVDQITTNTINIMNFDTIDVPLQIVYTWDMNIGTYTSTQTQQKINLYINQQAKTNDLPSYYQTDLRYHPSLITSDQLQYQNLVLSPTFDYLQVDVKVLTGTKFYSTGTTIRLQFQINTDDEQYIGSNVGTVSTHSIQFASVNANAACMIQEYNNEKSRVLECEFTATAAMDINNNWVTVKVIFSGTSPIKERDFYWFRINICDNSSLSTIKHTVSLEYARNAILSAQDIDVQSISLAADSPTLLTFVIKAITIDLDPTVNKKLFMEMQSTDWPDQLIQGIDVSVEHAKISCLCYQDIPAQPTLTTQCYFHRKSLSTSYDYLKFHLIEIPLTISSGIDVKCQIPLVKLPSIDSTNLKIAFQSTIESLRPFISSRNTAKSQARYYQDAKTPLVSKTSYTIAQTYTLNFPVDLYDNSIYISSTTNNYKINISGTTAIDVPHVLIVVDPQSGPIFNKNQCLTYQDCQAIGTSILYYKIQSNAVTDFSTYSTAISLVDFAQKIFTDYVIQIYIYATDGKWAKDPTSLTIPGSKNGLRPPSAHAISANLLAYSVNTSGYLATYVFTSTVELQNMTQTHAFQLVLSKTEIPTATQACSARSLSNKALLLCRYTSDSQNHYYTVKILRTQVNIITTTMKIAITLEILNPTPAVITSTTATAKYEIRYYKEFISQSNYKMISTNSGTLTFDNSQQAAGYTQYSRTYLRFYRFSPTLPCDGVTITSCPIRFFYQNNLPATNYNTLQIQVDTGTAKSTSTAVTCLIKTNNSNGSFTRFPATCSFINSSGLLQISHPSTTVLIQSGKKYEIILTLGYLNLPVADFNNIDLLTTVTSRISSTSQLITKRQIKKYQGSSNISFQKFYILNHLESQTSSIYFEVALTNAQLSTNLYPVSYIEVLLPQIDYTSPLLSTFKIGQQIPCDISSTMASITNYEKPICTINLKSSTGPVFVRLEKISSYSANAILKLAIDDVKLISLTDYQTFDMHVQIQNGSIFYTKTAINLILIEIHPPYPSPIVDPTVTIFAADSKQLGATTTYKGSYTWPFTAQTAQFGDKYRVSFGTQGMIGIGNDISTLTYGDNIIWINRKTYRVVLKAPDRAISTSYTFSIINVINPIIANMIYYGISATFTTEFYSSYELTNQINQNYPAFVDFINPIQPINFVSFVNIPGYYPLNRNELFCMKFQIPQTLPFQEILIYLKDPTIMKFKSCHFIRYNGNELSQCNVISTSVLALFGISSTLPSPATHEMCFIAEINLTNPIFFNLKVTNNGVDIYNLYFDIPITSPTGYSPVYTSVNALSLNKVKYFNTLNTLTITQPPIYAGTNVQQLFFEFKAIKSLSYNSIASSNEYVQITITDNMGNFKPVVATDSNNLICYFLKKESNALSLPVYSNMKMASSCQLDTSSAKPIYKVGAPKEGLASGFTYLVIIFIDGSQQSFFQIPSSYQRDEFLFEMTGLPATVSDTIILSTTIQNFNSVSIKYTTMQQSDTDNMIILSANLKNSLQSTDSTHDIFLRVELDSQYYGKDAGLQSYYSSHSLPTFQNGYIHSVSSKPSITNLKLLASFGNPTNKREPIRYTIIPFSVLSASTAYTFIIPSVKNPAIDCQITLRVSLLQQDNSGDYLKVISRQTFYNNQRTQSQTIGSFTITQTGVNDSIQSVNMYWNTFISSYGASLTTSQFIILAYNNALQGILKTSFQKFTITGYDVYYFSNINIYVLQPQSTKTGTISVQFNPLSTSDDSADYGWQYGKIVNGLNTQYYNSGTSNTLQIISSISGISIKRKRGFTNVKSQYEVVLELNSPKIPLGGYLEIYLPPTYLIAAPTPVGDLCFPGKNVANDPSSPLVCYKVDDYRYRVQGTKALAFNTPIQINMFLVGLLADPAVKLPYVKAFGPIGQIAQSQNIASILIDSSPDCVDTANVILKYLKYIYCNEYGPFQFNFVLRNNDIIQSLGHFIKLTMDNNWPISPAPAIQSAQYKETALLTWYDSLFTNESVSPLVIDLPPSINKQFDKQKRYTFSIDTTQSAVAGQDGVKRPLQCGFYRFELEAYIGGNTSANIVEKNYDDFLLEPRPDTSFIVEPIVRSVNRKTAYRFTFTTNINIQIGDEIWLEFTTSNFINQIFQESLGFTVNSDGFAEIDCAENPGQSLISSTKIQCFVQKGSASAVPPVRAGIQIPVLKAIAANTKIVLWVSNIQNPSIVGQVASVGISVKRKCRNDYRLCNFYVSYSYFLTLADNPLFNTSNQILTAQSTTSLPKVYQTNAQHTFSLVFQQTVQTTDYIVIHYQGQNYNTARMSLTCTASTFCIVFPRDQIVLLKLSTIINASPTQQSISISGMTNGYFLYDNTQNFMIEVWDGLQALVNMIYYVPAIQFSYEESGMTMDITPTQTRNVKMPPPLTKNYFIRDYLNTVEIEIKGTWINQDIQSFYFIIPDQIKYIQNNYCNATMEIPAANRNPYPYRFDCNLIAFNMIELDMTNEMKTYLAAFQTYTIRIYLKFYIDLQTAPGVTNNFQFIGAIDKYPATYNQGRAISRAQQTIEILPYDLPDLSYLTFNTKGFYDRQARICQSGIEFYMILNPNTQMINYKIDQFVFRAPNEFAYPPVRDFDDCTIRGKFNDNVLACILERKYAETKVYMQPDVTYNHQPKIIEINDEQGNLFTAPCIPGAQYNMTIELYSQGTLVEKQTVITSPILGVPLAVSQLKIFSSLDAELPGIFEFKFQLGIYPMPQGYDAPQAQQYSTIVLTFESKDGFENDLGTGLKTGDELGCVIKQQIPPNQFQLKKDQQRLKCVLQEGWNSKNLPKINITGYQEIPAGSVVQFLITNIQALPISISNTISIGVAVTYKNTNVTAFFYEPTAFIPDVTTADARSTILTATLTKISTSPLSSQVLGVSDYKFDFTSGQSITTNDYIGLQFDPDQFDRFSDYSSVGCIQISSASKCSETHVFGITNLIYVKPSTNIAAGASDSITIQNLINPSYSYTGNINVQGFSQVNYKVDKVYPVSTAVALTPCSTFTQLSVNIDKIVGGENGATLTFIIIPGHQIPAYGALSILFPTQYQFDLLEMDATCNVSTQTAQNYKGRSRLSCAVSAYNRVDVLFNNATYAKNDKITLQILNVNTPNFKSAQTIQFTVGTYFDSNIYAGRKICQANINFPSMTYIPPSQCIMFVEQESSNVNALSLYTFKINCETQYIRDRSDIFIKIDKRFRITNPSGNILSCYSSDTTILASSNCQLTVNQNFEFGLQAKLRAVETQRFFQFSVYLINPNYPDNDYYFSSEISKYSSIYAVADDLSNQSQYIELIRPQVTNGMNSQIQILNVPRNAGEKSTYVLGIPPYRVFTTDGQVDTAILEFPSNFASNLGDNLVCGVYLTEYMPTQITFTYKMLLETITQKTKDSNYYSLPCALISASKIKFDTSKITSVNFYLIYQFDFKNGIAFQKQQQFNSISQNKWVNWIVKNIVNPSQYQKLNGFKMTYLSSNKINWYFEGQLVYQISQLPKSIQTTSLSISDNNVRTQAQYQLGIQASTILPYHTQMGISIRLPASVFSSVVDLQNKPFCSLLNMNSKTPMFFSFCDFYQFELLIENVLLKDYQISQLLVNITNIFNPTITNSCELKDNQLSSDISFFETKIIDLSIGEVLFTNNPNIDCLNCATYQKNLFDTNIIGPTILHPGVSYNFTIKLEKPANGLRVIPSCDATGIRFSPETIEFLNFEETEKQFNVIVRSDLDSSDPFFIKFTQTESDGKFYLPLIPQKVQVIKDTTGQNTPTISVSDVDVETTGYPIIVPVYVSQPPANLLNLIVQISAGCQTILKISPQLILIDQNTFQTNFTISVNTQYIPTQNCILYFSLSSYTTIVHKLTPILKHVSFSFSDSNITPQPLRVIIDKYQRTPSTSQDTPCLNTNYNYNTYLLKPSILKFTLLSTDANHAIFEAYTSSIGYFRAVFALQGSPPPTIEQMKNPYTYPYAISEPQIVEVQQIISNKVDYYVKLEVKKLESQTNFQVYGMVFNPNGYSDISYVKFKTLILNYGSIINIPLTELEYPEEVIDKLSKTLRIPKNRFINITSYEYNLQQQRNYQQDIMLKPNYFYEVIITPDPYNDNPAPKELAEKLINELLPFLKKQIPSFNNQKEVQTKVYIQVPPNIQISPNITYLSYYEVQISLKLLDQAYVYAQIRLSPNNVNLFSRQIYKVQDQQNFNAQSDQSFVGLTDKEGDIIITFDNILDYTYYDIFITVSTNMPYLPNIFYDDPDIKKIKIQTPKNENLYIEEGDLTQLKSVKPDLAAAIERYLEIPFFHHIEFDKTEKILDQQQ